MTRRTRMNTGVYSRAELAAVFQLEPSGSRDRDEAQSCRVQSEALLRGHCRFQYPAPVRM